MSGIIGLLMASGVAGIISGDITGMLLERLGKFGFGGKVARALIEKKKREKLIRQAEKDGISDMLAANGARRRKKS